MTHRTIPALLLAVVVALAACESGTTDTTVSSTTVSATSTAPSDDHLDHCVLGDDTGHHNHNGGLAAAHGPRRSGSRLVGHPGGGVGVGADGARPEWYAEVAGITVAEAERRNRLVAEVTGGIVLRRLGRSDRSGGVWVEETAESWHLVVTTEHLQRTERQVGRLLADTEVSVW